MKLLLALFLIAFNTSYAAVTMATKEINYPSGFGTDVVRFERDDDVVIGGVSLFYLRYNYITRRILALRLPHLRMERTCGLQRQNGGSLGDYKPKNINDILWVGGPGNGNIIFRNYEYNRDTNEVPTVRVYRINNDGQLSEYAKQYLSLLCDRRANRVSLTWTGHGDCRWKPENWHKPGDFPFEYKSATVQDTFNVRLECVRN